MNIEYTVPIYTPDEYEDDIPTHAHIKLTSGVIERIFTLSKAAKDLEVACIEDWDVTPDLLVISEDDDGATTEDWGGVMDAMVLRVTDTEFKWTFYIKHTTIECSVQSINIAELKDNIKMLRAKPEDLPRLAVSKFRYESSRELVEKRLKGE